MYFSCCPFFSHTPRHFLYFLVYRIICSYTNSFLVTWSLCVTRVAVYCVSQPSCHLTLHARHTHFLHTASPTTFSTTRKRVTFFLTVLCWCISHASHSFTIYQSPLHLLACCQCFRSSQNTDPCIFPWYFQVLVQFWHRSSPLPPATSLSS